MSDSTVIVPVKPWWKSRTIWTNVLTTLAAVLLFINDSAQLIDLPPRIGAYLLLVAGIINVVLRTLTIQPIDNSSSYTTAALKIVAPDGDAREIRKLS